MNSKLEEQFLEMIDARNFKCGKRYYCIISEYEATYTTKYIQNT